MNILLNKILTKANSGDPEYLVLASWHYLYGELTEKNVDKGIFFLRKASGMDYPEAHFRLAGYYMDGDVIEKDCNEAVRLYKRASDLGHYKASHWLGFMYMSGDCVNINYAKSLLFFDKAYKSGHIISGVLAQYLRKTKNVGVFQYLKSFINSWRVGFSILKCIYLKKFDECGNVWNWETYPMLFIYKIISNEKHKGNLKLC